MTNFSQFKMLLISFLCMLLISNFIIGSSATFGLSDAYNYYNDDLYEISSAETKGKVRNSRSLYQRIPLASPHDLGGTDGPSCEHMKLTQNSAFVVLILSQTSGNFLGMGSILDQETVLTSYSVVRNTLDKPKELMALAGRLNPWWGDGSQVYNAKQILLHPLRVAIVRLSEPFSFNKFVRPIRIINKEPPSYEDEYTKEWGVFGLPRGTWSRPGDEAERTSVYLMKIETVVDDQELQQCQSEFPHIDFNFTYNTCTMANFSFGWGCEGSPAIAVDENNNLRQVAVVTDASRLHAENHHVLVKLGLLYRWIKAHSLIGFFDDVEDQEN